MSSPEESEGLKRIYVQGAYFPQEGKILACVNGLKNLLNEESQIAIFRGLQTFGREDYFKNILLARLFSEELAHFVEHTRGYLPSYIPMCRAQVARRGVPLQIQQQKRSLLKPREIEFIHRVAKQTFIEMGYNGGMPLGGVQITENMIQLVGTTPDYIGYLGRTATLNYDPQADRMELENRDISGKVVTELLWKYEGIDLRVEFF